MRTKPFWKTIGRVGVDSGTLMVIDPCYATKFNDNHYLKYVVEQAAKQTVNVPFDKGYEGMAAIFSSGCGDGMYEVKAKFEVLPLWGERITEVRIIMR